MNTKAIKMSTGDRVFVGFNYLFVIAATLVVLYPLIYIISASVSDPSTVQSGEMWLLPKGFTWEGYERILANQDIWMGYKNTIIYTVLAVIINLAVTIPCAYALSRPELYGKNFFVKFMMITMFISGGMIPTYLLIKQLGMLNSIWALLIPSATGVYNIVVTRSFFQTTIPRELEEAAIVDGCSDFRIFFQIVLPLSAPILAVIALFVGVGRWNGFMDALIYLSDRAKFPLQMILRELLILQDMSSNATASNASIQEVLNRKRELVGIIKYGIMIVSTLPIIVVYPFLQRYFVKGMLVGSLKG
ncbi:putative aldouronate transport system permease protein [Pilibacter termitis]|uniref:Putative aldouronate transport system permease protein n=1 Tax=Pilibacter termitis TaxID=263852 RepID=A0A1T4MA40_9ENTE|nr:carbohydrate ABC transporter permease [Pilibacter termitis]SJZ63863.1 putative aldouronate transport system permease protein [Pilibacter termitis]